MSQLQFIPRPLVRLNQWIILLSVLLTWITANAWVLLLPLMANLWGVLVGVNPIIKVGKVFLRKPLSTYIPEDKQQQKFNSGIASFCLGIGWLSYMLHWQLVGHLFTAMVAIASSIAIAGFCIGCFVQFQWKQWQYKRAQKV
ncbi:DUF4395 domain-containing protein [Lysinibacillus piscis]|uniref:DUF4395 domain-containing protein n=1 Tax=Lysinibacillus piscis TaxID=2518931 RepID=A0ABQ5NJ79_9BACI|nr:DUF4395 domain-containing protein [Lysinibacillus sp. KH24]GLC88084.1 hypothetical protein LYSBPC_12110 [Lysinibacillus sp. KH24]